jgi:hypothetical protein
MSIGGNADEKLRLLVVAGKGDAPRPQIWTIIFPESCLWLERENSEFI